MENGGLGWGWDDCASLFARVANMFLLGEGQWILALVRWRFLDHEIGESVGDPYGCDGGMGIWELGEGLRVGIAGGFVVSKMLYR